jgi:flagellar hook-associated protein 3 FlgL
MMMFHAIGDLAQSLTMRRHSAGAQSDVMRLTRELSSGQVADVSQHLQGSFGQLANMENQMTLKEAHKTASVEASFHAATMQGALEQVQNQLADLSGRAMLVGYSTEGPALDAVAHDAREALGSIVSALNADVAGRRIFAGNSFDNPPLADADQLMAAVRSAVSGSVDAAAVIAALDTFFDSAGGGFETLIYRGGTDDLSPHRLGGGEEVRLSIRADDQQIRDVLKDTVMAALAADDTLTFGGAERTSLLRTSGSAMMTDIDAIIGLRSDLGFAEERIDQAMSRNAAEYSSLKMARNDLLSVDIFETASALEQAQFRLETIYTLTARTSRLNLVNFL